MRGNGLNLSGSTDEAVAGSCEHGYELSDSIKCTEFLD
jgi:hypothetical protein